MNYLKYWHALRFIAKEFFDKDVKKRRKRKEIHEIKNKKRICFWVWRRVKKNAEL